ncbi:hypothetical protein SLEP1_g51793 [Rubroshorea leprosula]|uniref:Uncharacterized protein n=1 Tax=Rubroshorea leprosula TaxID=152421 RepID=A0AAV5M4A6_9ROSI|nr:hypothetical protein SLEP1_g51793 [Rubroshorea leprosula]
MEYSSLISHISFSLHFHFLFSHFLSSFSPFNSLFSYLYKSEIKALLRSLVSFSLHISPSRPPCAASIIGDRRMF